MVTDICSGRDSRIVDIMNAAQRLADKTPEQLKMSFALWTRPVIGQFIAERFGIKLPVRTLGH